MCTMNRLSLYLLCFFVSAACAIDCTPTKGSEYCSCTGKDFTIDLSKILELPLNNIPETVGVSSYTYKFSPCEPVACVSGQVGNGIACQSSITTPNAWYLGRTTVPPVWNVLTLEPNLAFTVTYSGGDKTEGDQDPRERQALFLFQFGNQKELEIAMFGESTPNEYQLYSFVGTSSSIVALSSRAGGGGVEVGVVGLILMILFIVALVTYFFIGAIVNYHYRGSRGAEVIPNYAMWKALPFLVKDGFLFVISPCYKKEKYEKFGQT